jgi:putative membrane protein
MRNSVLLAGAMALGLTCAAPGLALAKDEAAFIKDAVQGDISEVQLGQLAAEMASSADVKAFGEMLVEDHGAHRQKAEALANTLGVAPPTEPKPEAVEEMSKLQGLSGAAFDQEFVSYMVDDHKKDIAEYSEQASEGGQTGQFAQDTLPTLQKHLQTAEGLAGSAT